MASSGLLFTKNNISQNSYKTYDSEFLAIVEVFKGYQHYLKGYKQKVLVLTDYNSVFSFMNTKSLSSCQIYWIQKLSKYYVQINYCQSKKNRVANLVSYFS